MLLNKIHKSECRIKKGNGAPGGKRCDGKGISDRENRENNIIIFNAEESNSETAATRKQHDQELFDDICEHVLESKLMVKNIMRIGTKVATNDEAGDETVSIDVAVKPRPIKVCYSTNFDKRKFLSSLHKLNNAPDKLKSVSVKHDLSTDQRLKSKELVAQAYKKNQEESPENFLYKVRGPPHAKKIVKVYNR